MSRKVREMHPPRRGGDGTLPDDPPPLAMAKIRAKARAALREVFETAAADPSSDAYTMLEIMCLNQFIEAELKTREMDVMEVFRAQNQGKQLAVKATQLETRSQLLEAQIERVRLQNRVLRQKLAEARDNLQQAKEAQQGGKPFDYDRALNQISALIGLRGGEEFVHDKKAPQPN